MLKILSERQKIKKRFVLILVLIALCAYGGIDFALYRQHSVKTTPEVQATKKPMEQSKAATTQPTPKIVSPTPTPSVKPADAPCTGNIVNKLILVSISSQHMWACEIGTLVNQSAVTTGATQAPNGVDDATNIGTWHIYAKQINQHLRGSDINGNWDDFVQYWIPFDGPIGFHDASWQTFPFGNSDYKISGSHGCVHLPLDTITWLYGWAPIGTTVTVIE